MKIQLKIILKILVCVSFFCLRGDFLCTFCRSITSPEIEYCDESARTKENQGLGAEDQRVSTLKTSLEIIFIIFSDLIFLLFFFILCLQKCERLLLYIFCHELSIGFRDPVPISVSTHSLKTHHSVYYSLINFLKHFT